VATAGSLREPLPPSVGMTVAFRWDIKRGKPFRGVAIAKSRLLPSSTVSPPLFFLPASFGQPTTSPSLLLLRPLAEQAG
jgi:hypothetical protein